MSLRICPLKKNVKFLESDGCPDRECAFWISRGYCCAVVLAAEDAQSNTAKMDELISLMKKGKHS